MWVDSASVRRARDCCAASRTKQTNGLPCVSRCPRLDNSTAHPAAQNSQLSDSTGERSSTSGFALEPCQLKVSRVSLLGNPSPQYKYQKNPTLHDYCTHTYFTLVLLYSLSLRHCRSNLSMESSTSGSTPGVCFAGDAALAGKPELYSGPSC